MFLFNWYLKLMKVFASLYFLVPESFHKKLVQIGKVVSEKIRFDFSM